MFWMIVLGVVVFALFYPMLVVAGREDDFMEEIRNEMRTRHNPDHRGVDPADQLWSGEDRS